MANRRLKEENVEWVDFLLAHSPHSVQFTVHINNMFLAYPKEKKKVLNEFRLALDSKLQSPFINYRVKQLVEYYGLDFCKKWFKDIYNWKFEESA